MVTAAGTALSLVLAQTTSAEPLRNQRLSVGLGIQDRSFDMMSFGDVQPVTRGEFGGRTEFGYRFSGPWWAVLAGHFSGSWFDFNGPSTSGKIESFSWLIRGGIDRRAVARRAAFYFGLGAEYGESRSWLDAISTRDEGPHIFLGGGYVKAGAQAPLAGPLDVYAEAVSSTYHAHARQAATGNKFNWLGRSFEGAVGLRLVLLPER